MDEKEEILWTGTCIWWRVLLWRWKDVAALALVLLVMAEIRPLTAVLDPLGDNVALTWFSFDGFQGLISSRWTFIALGMAAGWYCGQIVGALMSHRGRKFAVTEGHVVWGNAGEEFKAPLEAIKSIKEGRAADGRTAKITFKDGRRDVLIAGVDARAAVTAIALAKSEIVS